MTGKMTLFVGDAEVGVAIKVVSVETFDTAPVPDIQTLTGPHTITGFMSPDIVAQMRRMLRGVADFDWTPWIDHGVPRRRKADRRPHARRRAGKGRV
jgi:hypothetical protein